MPSPVRACNRSLPSSTCFSASFSTSGVQFSSVCGQVIAVQHVFPDAFRGYHDIIHGTIDGSYVDGVSIT